KLFNPGKIRSMKGELMKRIFLMSTVILFFSSAAFAGDITSNRAIKEFFKEQTNLRIAEDSIISYKATLNELSLKVIQRCIELVKKDDRKTILKRDVEQASEEVFRRAPMNIDEIMEKIKPLSIIELAELNKKIKAYADELLEQRKE
ncbi:MAG: hypothetical protein KAI72_08850, partial [Candidatus Pacebacteria bacterium]|nr:hypothetical protein [Candidatus Paceibacterota bacterium]